MSRVNTVHGMRASFVLDRRSFLVGAAGIVGAVPAAWRLVSELAPAAGGPDNGHPVASAIAGDSMDWAVDHIFGTYPPYAHAIPYGRQVDPSPVSLEAGEFDPILMI